MVHHLADGTVVWTSPAGDDSEPRLRGPISSRKCALRGLDDARKAEIAARKFRNHMRDMLFLFKGTPSISPFATWINERRAPEELPPDWSRGYRSPRLYPTIRRFKAALA